MAVLVTNSNGNFSDMSTWRVALNDNTSPINSINITTSNILSPEITGAGETITSVGLFLSQYNNPGTNTITIEVYNKTDLVVERTITARISTLNIQNVNTTTAVYGGWFFVSFDSSLGSPNLTLITAKKYEIRVRASATNVIRLQGGSTTQISYCLPTTTQPSSFLTGDHLIINGLYNYNGTQTLGETIYTNTVNYNGAITFASVSVSINGILKYSRTAGTYTINYNSLFRTHTKSEVDMGKIGDEIPNNVTCILNAVMSSNNSAPMFIYGGDWYADGANKTPFVTLGADVSSGTLLTLSTAPTNWVSNDRIYISGTTRVSGSVYNDDDSFIQTISGTSLTLQNAITSAKGGDSSTYIQAHVINSSRNVQIGASNNSSFRQIATISISYTSRFYLYNTQFINFRFGLSSTGGINTIIVEGCSFEMWTNTTNNGSIFPSALSYVTTYSFNNNSIIRYGDTMSNMLINNGNILAKNTGNVLVRRIGSNNVFTCNSCTTCFIGKCDNNASDNIFYNNFSSAMIITSFNFSPSTYSNFKLWRNGLAIGFSDVTYLNGNTDSVIRSQLFVYDNFRIFGNTRNFNMMTDSSSGGATHAITTKTLIKNSYIYGGTSPQTAFGIDIQNINAYVNFETLYFDNCVFGKDDLGNNSNFSTACVRGASGVFCYLNNCQLFGTEQAVINARYETTYSAIGIVSTKHNGVLSAYRVYQRAGYLQNDSTYGGMRIVPSIANQKTVSNTVKVLMSPSNGNATISVSVRRSINNVPSEYPYINPLKLMLMVNPFAGILAEIECQVISGGTPSGSWETLSYTLPSPVPYDCVLEFYVETIGGTNPGYVTIKGWSVVDGSNNPINNDGRSYQFIGTEGPFIDAQYNTGGGGGGGTTTNGSFAFFG